MAEERASNFIKVDRGFTRKGVNYSDREQKERENTLVKVEDGELDNRKEQKHRELGQAIATEFIEVETHEIFEVI